MSTLRILVLGLSFLSLFMAPSVGAQQSSPQIEDPWASLGPTGPFSVSQVAVSTSWPADRFIYVGLAPMPMTGGQAPLFRPKPSVAARSYDGGQTWEQLAGAPPIGALSVVHGHPLGRVLLASTETSDGASSARVLRSTDDGASWHGIEALGPHQATFSVSPNVIHDGTVFALTSTELFESRDFGLTWTPRTLDPNLTVSGLWLSPTYADDQTVVALVRPQWSQSTSDARNLEWLNGDARQHRLYVSFDGGRTFQPRSAVPNAGGVQMPWITSLVLSPDFARDGTLFAYATGIASGFNEAGHPKQFAHGAIFRSADRGESWDLSHEPYSVQSSARRSNIDPYPFYRLAISPEFARSGLVIATWGTGAPSRNPAIRYCSGVESRDYGQSWGPVDNPHARCWPTFFAGGPTPRVITGVQVSDVLASWTVRRLGSDQWSRIDLSQPSIPSTTYADLKRIHVAPDGTVFFGEINGLWALGDSVQPTFGRFLCTLEESPSIASAIAAAPRSRPYLGCPTGAPRMLEMRQRELGETLDLWIEGFGDHWYSLGPAEPPAPNHLGKITRLDKVGRPWSGVPDRVVEGELQEYAGGIVARLPNPDGRDSAIIVTTAGWERVPLDRPSPHDRHIAPSHEALGEPRWDRGDQ